MSVRSVVSRLGLVLVVALLVGTTVSIPVLSEPAIPVDHNLTVESHQPDSILATAADESGALSIGNADGSKHVLIDAGHSNRGRAVDAGSDDRRAHAKRSLGDLLSRRA